MKKNYIKNWLHIVNFKSREFLLGIISEGSVIVVFALFLYHTKYPILALLDGCWGLKLGKGL